MPKKRTGLSDEQIGEKIRLGKNFSVQTNRERKSALAAAKFAGVEVSSRARKKGFTIFFLNPSVT